MKHGISVIIPSRPHEPHLQLCLNSLMSQDFSDFEIIVVFNPKQKMNLQDNSLGSKLRISTSQKGVNCARNKGISLSRFDLVLFIDADCVIKDPKFLSQYFEIMQNNLALTAAGGPYQLPKQTQPVTQAYHYIQTDWVLRSVIDSKFRTRSLLGGNMIFRLSNLQNFRFEDALIFGGTETELFNRLVASGHQLLFVPDQVVEHCSELTLQSLKYKAKMQGLGRKWMSTQEFSNLSNRRGLGLSFPPSEISKYVSIYYIEFDKAYSPMGPLKRLLRWLEKVKVKILNWIEIRRLQNLL